MKVDMSAQVTARDYTGSHESELSAAAGRRLYTGDIFLSPTSSIKLGRGWEGGGP